MTSGRAKSKKNQGKEKRFDEGGLTTRGLLDRGLDAVFPARRIARSVISTSALQALNKARAEDPEGFDRALSRTTNQREAEAKEVGRLLNDRITQAVNPGYARRRQEAMKAEEKSYEPVKATGKFNPDAEFEFKNGGKVSSASKRADGVAKRGKTRGRFI